MRLVALLFLPLGLVAAGVLITLPQRMNDLALASAEERVRGVAEVMASLLAPDLDFDDREHARSALGLLAAQPGLLGAELFGRGGNTFAVWPEGPDGRLVSRPDGRDDADDVDDVDWELEGADARRQVARALTAGRTQVQMHHRHIEVAAPVTAPGGSLGCLFLRFATTGIESKRRANMAAAGLAAAVVALVGLCFSFLTARFLVRRQAAEEALRRSSESFATLSDSLPVALVLHRDERILYVNPAGVKLLHAGAAPALLGARLPDLLAAGEALPGPSGEGRVRLEDRTLSLAGGVKLSVEAASLQVQFGDAQASALVALDVTERIRMQERLLLSDRMASLGTLAAGVAHEINNPLAVVIGNLEFARDSIPDDLAASGGMIGEARGALEEGLDAAQRVARIVKDMKTLSRGDGDALAATDLDRTIEKSLHMVQGHLKHRAAVDRRLGGVPPVLANESRLVQVFVNLLINAAQAMPEGRARDNRIEVATSVGSGGTVVATVRDTGCGIPAAVRDRIFDPFFTTKPVGVGTGLGLSIVHNLVRAMNGRIELESEEGVGTTFSIHLSVAAQAAVGRGDAGEAAASRRSRVLLIDDELPVLHSVERLLAESHDVMVAQSARVALERIGRGESYDLILCDLRMPDMSGIELASQLDQHHPRLRARLVFMTGDIGEAGMGGPGGAPVDVTSIAPVLEKPFSRRELLEFVGRHLPAERRGSAVA